MKEIELPNFIRPYTPPQRKSLTHINLELPFRSCERLREACILASHHQPLGPYNSEYKSLATWLGEEMLND